MQKSPGLPHNGGAVVGGGPAAGAGVGGGGVGGKQVSTKPRLHRRLLHWPEQHCPPELHAALVAPRSQAVHGGSFVGGGLVGGVVGGSGLVGGLVGVHTPLSQRVHGPAAAASAVAAQLFQ